VGFWGGRGAQPPRYIQTMNKELCFTKYSNKKF
jgi:hypothetical protein